MGEGWSSPFYCVYLGMEEIQIIINQLLESEEGKQALKVLEEIPEWNQLVQEAADSL